MTGPSCSVTREQGRVELKVRLTTEERSTKIWYLTETEMRILLEALIRSMEIRK